MYTIFNAGNKEYKLRLGTRDTVLLEKQIGCNPLAIFGSGETIPTVTTMVHILHASLRQYNHGIGLDDSYNIFDEWLNDGHTMTDFIHVILDIYRASGLIKNKESADDTEKN